MLIYLIGCAIALVLSLLLGKVMNGDVEVRDFLLCLFLSLFSYASAGVVVFILMEDFIENHFSDFLDKKLF